MSNTIERVKFNQKFAMLTLHAMVNGINFICTSYSRTPAEQNALFKRGRSKCDGYENISYHQRDRARDIAIIDGNGLIVNDYGDHPDYAVLGEVWEALGGRWGGNFESFRDVFHYEY